MTACKNNRDYWRHVATSVCQPSLPSLLAIPKRIPNSCLVAWESEKGLMGRRTSSALSNLTSPMPRLSTCAELWSFAMALMFTAWRAKLPISHTFMYHVVNHRMVPSTSILRKTAHATLATTNGFYQTLHQLRTLTQRNNMYY